MQKLILALVVAALGLAGWQAYEASQLRDDLAASQLETSELRADLDQVAKALADLAAREPPPQPAPGAVPPSVDAAAGTPRLAPRGASPEVIARAVRELQDRVASVENLEEKVEGLEEKVERHPIRQLARRRYIHDLPSAADVLDLTSAQQADVERIVEYARRDMKVLHETPNEEGTTFRDIAKMQLQGGEGVTIAMPDFGAIQKFKNGLVPGTNETFGEAEKRIRDRGKQDVRDVLTPEQQKTWDRSHNDNLFGSSMGPSVFSFTTTTLTPDR